MGMWESFPFFNAHHQPPSHTVQSCSRLILKCHFTFVISGHHSHTYMPPFYPKYIANVFYHICDITVQTDMQMWTYNADWHTHTPTPTPTSTHIHTPWRSVPLLWSSSLKAFSPPNFQIAYGSVTWYDQVLHCSPKYELHPMRGKVGND